MSALELESNANPRPARRNDRLGLQEVRQVEPLRLDVGHRPRVENVQHVEGETDTHTPVEV